MLLTCSRVITVNIWKVYNLDHTIPAINTAFNALIAAKAKSLGSVRNIFNKKRGKIVDSNNIYQFYLIQ